MASVTICSDFQAQENKVSNCFHCFPIYLPWSDGTRCHDLKFSECWVLSQLLHSPLSPSSRGSLIRLCFRVVSVAYLKLLIFLPAVLIPTCSSSSLAFRMMYSAYELNFRVTIYSLDMILSPCWISPFSNVWLLLDLYTGFAYDDG